MEDILKFNRIQSKVQSIVKSEKITAAALASSFIAFGTDCGVIHTIYFSERSVRPFSAHNRSVNCISVDSSGVTIASCSDNGNVVLYSPSQEENREITVPFNEPVKSVCIDNDMGARKEKSFIAGCSSGQLIFHRTAWFSQKTVILFNGSGSPVSEISWSGNFVAWCDATHVRLMDISTQSAICYLDCPQGVSVQFPFPCHFFWENSTNLWISWADSVRHIELQISEIRSGGTRVSTTASSGGGASGNSTSIRDVVVRTRHDWQADCIVCGISGFDDDHLVLLGYLPPEDESDGEEETLVDNDEDEEVVSGIDKKISASMSTGGGGPAKYRNHPELQIVRRSNGHLISADVLPMKGELVMSGPWGFQLVSSYNLTEERSLRWNLSEYEQPKEESKGRDGNRSTSRNGASKREENALANHPPVTYVVAPQDVVVARVRDVNDRITMALKSCDLQLAANLAVSDAKNLRLYKCHELVSLYVDELLDRDDPELAASECARLIGHDGLQWERWILNFASRQFLTNLAPFIPTTAPRLPVSIYEVVLENFLHNDSKSLFDVVCRWGTIHPPLFDRNELLLRLESLGSDADEWTLETRAKLYIFSGQFEQAIDCYLSISHPRPLFPHEDADTDPYRHVFELIEKLGLHNLVKDRIVNLVRLSKPLAANLLLRSIDKLSVSMVSRQLRADRQLLHWYLNLLFKEIPDQYNTPEYQDFHIMQVTLYAEFAPKFVRPVRHTKTLDLDSKSAKYRESKAESDFLNFLRTSNHAPLELALKECDKRRPPLYPEMIYILARLGNQKEALSILLKEIGDVEEAVNFVETHDQNLWNDLVEYSLKNHEFLTDLLDYVGVCSLNPNQLVAKIPRHSSIEGLKEKLVNIISQYKFQVFLNDMSNSILDHDALALLRQLNQSHRRGVKVDPNLRCAACDRPLFLAPALGTKSFAGKDARQLGADGKVWGSQSASYAVPGAAVLFSNKTALHRVCLDAIRQAEVHVNS